MRNTTCTFSVSTEIAPTPSFSRSQSVERGGCVALAIVQLERWPGDWRKHLRLAGAADSIPCIEAGIHSGDQAATLQCLLAIGSAG
jgi:hypothetical protein